MNMRMCTLLGVGLAALAFSFQCRADDTTGPAPSGFYIVLWNSDDTLAVAFDASTLQFLPDGHRRAHFVFVNALDLWVDYGTEFDCADHLRTVSALSHLAGGSEIDKVANGTEDTNWNPIGDDAGFQQLQDVACKWDGYRSHHQAMRNMPDFETLLESMSARLK